MTPHAMDELLVAARNIERLLKLRDASNRDMVGALAAQIAATAHDISITALAKDLSSAMDTGGSAEAGSIEIHRIYCALDRLRAALHRKQAQQASGGLAALVPGAAEPQPAF